MQYSYVAYGLGIHSELELPELEQKRANPDIVIRMGHFDFGSSDEKVSDGSISVDADTAYMQYDGIGAFAIRRGAEITIESDSKANDQQLRLLLLGPVFAIMLHQRGLLVLHASAVAQENSAVAILAQAGAGKSTLAATLLTRGYRLVADDILALAPDPAKLPTIFPAFPFLKVSSEALQALGHDVKSAPQVNAQLDKRVWHIADAHTLPVTLNCIYVLCQGERPSIQAVTAQDSFIELVRHTFVAPLLDTTDAIKKHFQQCSIIANQVSVRRLRIPPSFDALGTVAELIDADFSRITTAA